ncbi:NAD(P)-dependent dehydrogenase (short-subunit alcohol dehydrogenase family) [Rhodococcus sp. OK519]|uniref:SDR family NAD(P)-dependent oxidoreductase n=1 Tax=Rhodococcus sp. OK519 TaxID=2135729 RepID=UPI000D3DC55C|nr:NAD(P)-dependent dehydrogenase (short-subunit alcohol dehydrogenase family) [Rhodococcus sp. OK519]
MAGRIAVVTGASKGLGRAIALGYAAAGATVVVSSRKEQACETVVDEIRASGGQAVAVRCHVGDWNDCAALTDNVVQRFGRIDVLVNNAGIAPSVPRLVDVTEELFDKTFAVDLKGPLRLMALASEVMPDGSSIVNISSRASTRPSPWTSVYAAAKAGLNTLTVAAAQELGPRGIRVNTIVCGPFRTDSFERALGSTTDESMLTARMPLRRIGDPDEIVGTAVWLATPASSYVTGALISVDGGA